MLDVVKEEEFSTRETGDDLVSSFLLLKNDPLHSCLSFKLLTPPPRRTSLGNRLRLPLSIKHLGCADIVERG